MRIDIDVIKQAEDPFTEAQYSISLDGKQIGTMIRPKNLSLSQLLEASIQAFQREEALAFQRKVTREIPDWAE